MTAITKKKRKLIGIDGHWYDITTFIPHHPGGEIIEQFVGKDASSVFHAFHRPSVLAYRKPVAPIVTNGQEDVSLEFAQLGEFFETSGYYKTNACWYLSKIVITFAMLLISFACPIYWPDSICKYLGAIGLASFWQQCGFLMHDAEHNLITLNRRIDSWIGAVFATLCFGVSGRWWREEHFTHHALTACVNYETDFFDPQMREVIWAQNKKIWPFYTTKLQYYCIKIQHLTFLPICIFIGRIGIMIDSMKGERHPRELIAFILHWVWVCCLLSYLPSLKERVIFYSLAASLQGILHIQLLISHYSKDFHYVNDIGQDKCWYKMQVESNIDIETPWWMDWFHGGLNFHLVHHLYPRMPRYNFRRATHHVRELCKKHGLHYDSCGWIETVSRTLRHLRLMSQHFTLDPR